jgi:hypothetical protein
MRMRISTTPTGVNRGKHLPVSAQRAPGSDAIHALRLLSGYGRIGANPLPQRTAASRMTVRAMVLAENSGAAAVAAVCAPKARDTLSRKPPPSANPSGVTLIALVIFAG